jgi:hypothetical protein
MHIDDAFGAKQFAAKTGHAMLLVFDGRQPFFQSTLRHFDPFHIDHIGGADIITDAAPSAFIKINALNHRVLSPGLTTQFV